MDARSAFTLGKEGLGRESEPQVGILGAGYQAGNDAMEAKSKQDISGPLAVVARSVYLGRQSGLIEVNLGDKEVGLFFRHGELYLDRDDPRALKISPLLARAGSERPAADPELGNAVEALARELGPRPDVEAQFSGQRVVVELTGPLPTVRFVQELAIYGCDENLLLERLGGESEQLRTSSATPALEQLPGLEPDMAQVMVTLARPASVTSLLRGAGSDRLAMLRALTRLWSVGLVTRVGEETDEEQDWAGGVLSQRLLEQFTARIEEDLESEPLTLDAETHRTRLGKLLSGLGEMNHYQLLGIDPRASGDEIFTAYSALARIVHPSHAARLGLEGKEVAVSVMFEKATEAYLTLSDPRRRASYNTVAGVHVQVAVDRDQRDEEKRSIAEQNYRRAASCLSQMDFSLAVDLLKEAARMDPRPEYFARLGLAQSKNPNWHRHAVESYRRAVELDPDNAGTRAAYGTLLEEMDRRDEARKQYQEALELMPDNPDAQAGLDRLGTTTFASLTPKSGGFRSLFAKSAKESE